MSEQIGRYQCPHCGCVEALTVDAVLRHAMCAPDPRDARIAALEAEVAKLMGALQFIEAHGGTFEPELGVKCDGTWCAEQARAALKKDGQ